LQYIFDTPSKRRDSVIYPGGINETYYWASLTSSLNQPPPTIVGEPSEDPRDANAYWEYLGKEEFFVAAKLAIFEESFVKNTINVGNNPGSAFANIVIAGGRIDPYFAIGQNGTVGVSGDQTGTGVIGYDRAGIFMGTFDSSGTKTPRFSLKNGTGTRFLRWDGANLEMQGSINIVGGQAQTDISNSFASASNALLNAQISGSNALDVARDSGSVRPNTQRISKEAVPSDGNGLYLGSNNLGYYADGGWKTYMSSNGDFFLTGSGGGFLEWNNSTSNLNIAGSINITGGTAKTQIDNLSSSLQELSGSVSSSAVVDAAGRIKFLSAPAASGLYLGNDRLGFYDSGEWKTYMDNTGQFFLTGSANSGLSWDGSQLTIVGAIRQISPGVPEGRVLGIWNNISNGFQIFVRDIVTHNGRTWVANTSHSKGASFEPGVSAVWEIAADSGTSGTAGVSGTNGANGANGTNGVNGTNGANGTNGVNGTNGPAGGPGPGVVFRGEYVSGETYFFTANRRDIVKSGGTFYLFLTATTDSGTTSHSAPPSGNWTAFGAQFSSVATDVLLAQDANITRGLVMGADATGSSFIRSSGATSLTTGTGFFMSSSGNFRFGDSVSDTGSFVYWDGALLEVGGIIKTRGGQNSELGNWLVDDQGRFRDSGSKVVLNADQKGMFIQDSTGATKLSVRTGELSSLTAGSATNAPTTINHSALTYTTNQGFTQTFSTTGFSTTLSAGSYQFTLNSTGITGTITHTSPTTGYFSISYAYQILNASNELAAFIGLGAGTSTGTGGSVIGQNQTGTISIQTTGTYTIRPIYTVTVGFGAPGDVTFPTQNFSPGTITFSPVTNFAELTDSGLQIVESAVKYIKIRRNDPSSPAQFVVDSRGVSYFEHDGTGGSDNALRISGSITPWTAEEGTLGKAGQRWDELHVVDIFANGVMNMAGATGFRITIPNTATDIGGRGRANAWTTYSDRRIKDNITSIESGLNIISSLNPVKYRQYSSEYDESGSLKLIKNEFFDTVGFIAQEVNDILPEVVSVGNETTLWGINDEKITPYLVRAIQELSKKVNDLELLISSSNNL
jgi:hypothetical protein